MKTFTVVTMLLFCFCSTLSAQLHREIIIVAERGAIRLPTNASDVAINRVVVESSLKTAFERNGVLSVRRAFPDWLPPSDVMVKPIQKGVLLAPDAVADLSLFFVLRVTGENVGDIVADLSRQREIVAAQLNDEVTSLAVLESREIPLRNAFTLARLLTPNDPAYTSGASWGFGSVSQGGIGASGAWQINTGSSGVKIALLDTGIETTHADFGHTSKIAGQYDFVNGDADAYPDLNQNAPDHGTAVAGIAAGLTNNQFGSPGVCGGDGVNPGCSVLAAKTLGATSIWQNVTLHLTNSSLAGNAAVWALQNGAHVLSNSWCTSSANVATHTAFRQAHIQGRVVTAAMGNTQSCGQTASNIQVAPAAYSDILMPVGATDQAKNRVSFANSYTWESGVGNVAVMAPGVNHAAPHLGNATLGFSGTSAATPFVSGLAGLVFSQAQARGWTLSSTDVRQIIQLTAHDLESVGWDANTGYGLIQADSAMRVMTAPRQLAMSTASPSLAGCVSTTPIQNWTFWGSWQVLFARRCEVQRQITFTQAYTGVPLVWGRPVQNGGVTPSNPNSEVYYTGVVPGTVTTTGATLKTFAYELFSLQGQFLGWYPAPPSQLNFGYAVLGVPAATPPPPPFEVSASVPSYVTTKTTYSLNGSASATAYGWQWDRSDDQGWSWYSWDANQNSSFIAYGGDYLIDWRVSANRVSDGALSIAGGQTHVCTLESCDGPPIESGQSASHSGGPVSGEPATDHYGAGIWVGVRSADTTQVVQLYSLSGSHELRDRRAANPFMNGSSVQEANAFGKAVRASFERTSAKGPTTAYAVKLSGDWRPVELQHVGLAIDPDLGAAADDSLGVDPDGLVWVMASGGTSVGYKILGLRPGSPVRIRQFSSNRKLDRLDPVDSGEALVELRAHSSLLTDVRDDVRFLIAFDASALMANNQFSMLVTRADDLASLRAIATEASREHQGASTSSESTPQKFGLRQSVPHGVTGLLHTEPSFQAGGSGTSSSSTKELLQQQGITSLDFDLPADNASTKTTIRIYTPAGRLVRTLLDAEVSGGTYHMDWDARDDQGMAVQPGVYLAVMTARAYRGSIKLVVVPRR